MCETEDILFVDKPRGMTSFDVIRVLRNELCIRKMGHAGTLDPLATGLLIVGVGSGTKKLHEYLKLPKEYIAEILIGEKRSTGDMEGRILEKKEVSSIEQMKIVACLNGILGTHEFPVSIFSALKKDGVPYYKRARRAEKTGESIEAPLRSMTVRDAELLSYRVENGAHIITVRFTVESGTYIRSLGEAVGACLGYPATLFTLRRTRIGEWSVDLTVVRQVTPLKKRTTGT